MGLFSNSKQLNWNSVSTPEEIDQLIQSNEPVLLFKHSNRCGVSRMALSAFEKDFVENDATNIYLIDVVSKRQVSNHIENISGIRHESPQVLLLSKKEVIYHASHSNIDANEINKLMS